MGVGWCPGSELNRYVPFGTRDFNSHPFSSYFSHLVLFAITTVIFRVSSCAVRSGPVRPSWAEFGQSRMRQAKSATKSRTRTFSEMALRCCDGMGYFRCLLTALVI